MAETVRVCSRPAAKRRRHGIQSLSSAVFALSPAAVRNMAAAERQAWSHAFAATILMTVALLLTTTPAFPSHSWATYHWARTANPFTLNLGDNVSATWDAYLGEARTDWSNSSVLNTQLVTGSTSPKRCRPTRGRVEVCSERYGFNGWLGLAQVWVTGSHITQAITKLNDSYFSTATYNTPAWRRLVMCQEVGHAFGLDHQDESFGNPNLGTCMDYTSDPDGPPSNEHPNAHDYEQLETIYAHLDESTTIAARVRAMPSTDDGGTSPADWGRAVAFTADGKPRVFLKRIGPNRWLRTHVLWIEERR